MKVIQSFWTAKQSTVENCFGWNSPRFHAISWALSSIQLSKFYDVELYTDQLGKKFLIDQLNLPYKKVHIVLDELNCFSKDFWAIPKIKSYFLQNTPFLHVDGDVFIWKKFPEDLLKADIISQNLEITTDYYKSMWNEISPYLRFIPKEMQNYISLENNFACNMGVFGGNDIEFIHKYSKKSFEFAEKNLSLTEKKEGGNFNIFFEQVLLFEMMHMERKKSNYIFNEISKDNDYIGFGDFDKVPFNKTYLHLLGFYKRAFPVCKLMETYFIANYPKFFKKISVFFKNEYKYLRNLDGYSFTKKENIKRQKLFIDKNKINYINNIDENYLFDRDITCISLHKLLLSCINNRKDFYIKRLKGNFYKEFSLERFNKTEEERINEYKSNRVLCIDELNNEENIISIDEIDELLLDNFEEVISFKILKEELLKLLDDDAQDIKNDFIKMIEMRISYYLKNRIIIIWN